MFKSIIQTSPLRKTLILKWAFIVAACFLANTNLFAQVGISNVSITPHASSIFELRSTTLGFLPPRMTTVERDAIASPATGLVVYNTTTNQLNYFNGASWQLIAGGAITSLNGLTGTSQTFVNGTNVTMTSAGTTHTLGWTGQLGVMNGGTGNSSIAIGEIPYGSAPNTIANLAAGTSGNFLKSSGAGAPSWSALVKSDVGLGNVENTALSTWPGTANITTLGTIGTGTWNATTIADGKIAAALTGKTYNALTLTAQAIGFTIAGGTTSKTLTVPLDATVSGTNTGDQAAISGNAGSATLTAITDDIATAATMYPTWVTTTSGNQAQKVSSTKLSFVPSTGILTSVGFAGALTGNVTGNVTGSSGSTTGNAATVTTNANLTGAVTSVGNATTIAANAVTTVKILDANVTYAKIQNVSATNMILGRVTAGAGIVEEIPTTGSGNVVRATSPTLVTPVLGVATATTINKVTITAPATSSTLTIADSKTLTVPLDATVSGTNTGDQATVAGNAGSATLTAITDDNAAITTMYPTWVTSTSGNLAQKISSTKLSFIPSTGILTSVGFAGALTGNVTGNVTGSSGSTTGNAATVTTNANLTGDVTSIGNATSIAANTIVTADIVNANVTYAKIQNVSATNMVLGRVSAGAGIVEEIATTGTGNVVRATTPTLVTPVLGAATGTSLALGGGSALTTTNQTGTGNLVLAISPTFTGVPAAPTAGAGTNTTQLATTAFVTAADNLKANIASPTLTGVPAAPTAGAGTNTTQLATTAFVTTADNLKANIASPTLTGVPAAPTAALGTNTTQLATTAFVIANAVSLNLPYGSLSSSTTQLTNPSTNAKLITFETNELLNLITHSTTVNTSRITIQVDGTYLITYSAVVSSGTADIDIWLRQNGVDVARSNSRTHYLTTDTRVLTVTYLMTAVATDYFELVQSSTSNTGGITAFAAGTGPTRPSIPSIILTINKISD